MVKYILTISLCCCFLIACDNDNNGKNNNHNTVDTDSSNANPLNKKMLGYKFNYALSTPSLELELPKKLKEISGLACYQDKWILAVQDEKGTMFLLDINSGEVVDDIKFAKEGDYEGIACVGDSVYILRADGLLEQVENWQGKKRSKGKNIKTGLNLINDAEGLDYDAITNSLLIACKGSGVIGSEDNSYRSIFAYSLESLQLNTKPILDITIDKVNKYVQDNIAKNPSLEVYSNEIEKKDGSIQLAPSAIAVHPISQDFYILSAVGRSLIVMNRKNEIVYIERLTTTHFEQPEGLTFSSNGDMFISSEGQKGKAKVYRFDYVK